MRALTGAELDAELVLAVAKLINRPVKLISKLSHHGKQVFITRYALRGRCLRFLEFFLSSAPSAMPVSANTASAAATERLSRVVAGTSTVRVHWKGLFSLSGAQMVSGGYSEA